MLMSVFAMVTRKAPSTDRTLCRQEMVSNNERFGLQDPLMSYECNNEDDCQPSV